MNNSHNMFHAYPRPRTKSSWEIRQAYTEGPLLSGKFILLIPKSVIEIHSQDIEVKVRGIGLNPEGFVQLSFQPDRTLHVQLSSPAWAIAPGQPAVFYREDRVIGGGIVL